MAYRATKSGLAAEAHSKIAEKYDSGLAQECLEWIQRTLGESFNTSGDADNFHNVLKDGYYLVCLMNKLQPGSISAKLSGQRQKLAFKQMECIGKAIEVMSAYGVADHDNFQTVDLYEAQNLNQVVNGIQALGRKAQSKGVSGIGPKEADANKREFTDEQLKAGQNIIGLQMGTNKGASQKGMNIGNTRHIVD